MYKVLLIDDEVLDLEGMRTFIPWDELGMELVAAVTNSLAALDVVRKEKIDILVTDVHMPGLTGLVLAKKALEKWPDIRIIFVSGYQDFGYVKQALSLNACNYVLKPMDDKELVESLVKVRQELDQKRKTFETESAYKQMVPIVKNEYLLQLLEGGMERVPMDVLHNEYQFDQIQWPVKVAVLEIDDFAWKLQSSEDGQWQKLLNEFSEFVMKMCRENNIEYVCKVTRQRIALFLDQTSEISGLAGLINNVKSNFPFTITAGVGGAAINLEALNLSYRQAVEALEYKMFYGKSKLLDYQDIHTTEFEDVKKLEIRLDSLFDAMSKYELVNIHDELEKLFRLAINLHSKFTIHNFAMFIIMKLDGFLHTLNEDLFQMLGLELQNLDILHQLETVDDIHSWLRRRAYEISEKLYIKKQKKNWKLISEIIEYVQSRLHENITLRDVADHFSFSPNYLGHLFKEENGKNFSDYVISLRMEKASGLLKEGKLKIYEVADQVGYRYLPYFSRQFKETFGMTPMEYRRKH